VYIKFSGAHRNHRKSSVRPLREMCSRHKTLRCIFHVGCYKNCFVWRKVRSAPTKGTIKVEQVLEPSIMWPQYNSNTMAVGFRVCSCVFEGGHLRQQRVCFIFVENVFHYSMRYVKSCVLPTHFELSANFPKDKQNVRINIPNTGTYVWRCVIPFDINPRMLNLTRNEK
jgi:hypothetical protein